MSLINYAEPMNLGGMLIGFGAMTLYLVLGYIFYKVYIKLSQYFDVIINREAKHELFEEAFLDKIALKKGIDLEKELIRRKMLSDKRPKSLRKMVETEIYKEMFGDKPIKK